MGDKSETVSKATGAAAAAAQAVNRRRSNVVKEVERLKENREKRRAQQAQILEEQEQLRNKDPGNPNWEFLQMILDYKEERSGCCDHTFQRGHHHTRAKVQGRPHKVP